MRIIKKVLEREELQAEPPVLMDIGASGKIHPAWKALARYSICLAFDADDRTFSVREETGRFRKLYVYNRIVTAHGEGQAEFYLTRSPSCSSLLKPDNEKLAEWAFADLFEVEQVVRLETVDLGSVLQERGLKRIDWFKTDSQGTDLRLFQSLGEETIRRVLVAEFEPGIIDAYEGEDKLHALMAFMDQYDFWMSDMAVRGSQRIRPDLVQRYLPGADLRKIRLILKTAPGWAEVGYLNILPERLGFSQRDYLLAWLFAYFRKHFGFALEVAASGQAKFDDPIFEELVHYSLSRMRFRLLRLPHMALRVFCRKTLTMLGE